MCTSVQMPKQDAYIGRCIDFWMFYFEQQCRKIVIYTNKKTRSVCVCVCPVIRFAMR